MLRKLLSLFSAKKPDGEEKKETKGAEARRTPTPEQAYRKRVAKKRRKAQRKSRRRNRK